jgi:hypothetical protein
MECGALMMEEERGGDMNWGRWPLSCVAFRYHVEGMEREWYRDPREYN